MMQESKILALKKRIKKTLIKERVLLFAGGILGFAASMLAIWILLSLLAGVIILPVWAKVSLLGVSGLLCLYLAWKLAFSRLFSGTYELTALKLEKKFPDLKGRLIAALQFSRISEADNPGFSNSLMTATLVQAEEKSSGLDFNRVISAYPLWQNSKAIASALVTAVLLLVIFPGLFSYSYKVYSNPTELITPPLGYKLSNYPGSTIAIKYRDLDIGGILLGDRFPEDATVYYKYAGGIWQKTEINLTGSERQPGSYGDSLLFYTTLKQVRRSLEYYVKAGRITTPVTHIDVVDRPRVTGIKLSMFYPKYTGLKPAVIDENEGNITAVVGTRVNMKIETNVPAVVAEMVFDDSSRSVFEINGLTGEHSLRVEEDRSYTIHLVDRQGEVNPDPIEYYITAVPDEYPTIDVVRPGVDVNLTEEMLVPLLLRISDDYGFSSLVMKYSIVSEGREGSENVAVLHFSDKIKTQGEVSFNWDVEPLGLMPSDYIKYYFDIADNDNINGPKVTQSRTYIARLPSLEEIISQTESDYNQQIDRSEEYLKQHRDLAERLKNIARKIEQDKGKQDEKLAWQHQKELEDIARKDEEISEQLKEASEQMKNLVDKMAENKMATRELLEKLSEIQKLFNEVATPEMREARLRMLEALKQMDPKEIDDALKNYQMTQEELMKRLDRTIALLKKMKIEQKVNSMVEMAKELVNRQENVNQKSSESEPEQLPKLAPSEKKVEQGLENLKEESKKLREMLKDIPYRKSEDAEKFCSAVEGCEAEQNMQNMTEKLTEMEKEQAMEQGEQALSKLLKLMDKMEEGQASMCQKGGGEVARMMRNAIEDINYVSNEQEGVIKTAGEIRGNSEVLRDLASEQQRLREMTRTLDMRIEEIGRESPFIAAELNNLIENASQNMDLSIDNLFDRRGPDAVTHQKEAMYNLNRAAVRMLDALESQKNCNKGGSCDKPSQMLQSLCNKQQMLNQQTQSMCQNPGQGSPQFGDAMRRLAAEQGAIKKSLEELQKEFGDNREVLGRLDAVADDMQKVTDALEDGDVGQETLDRQLKVYSRMLDATRTMQRKDFTEQRKAAVGEDVLRSSPSSLSGNQLRGGLDLEDRLRQFLDEGYPPEYEEHIKAYFKALIEQLEFRTTQPDYDDQ